MKIEFKSVLAEFFNLPSDYSLPEKLSFEVQKWEHLLEDQIVLSRLGYPRTNVFKVPVLEDQLLNLMLPELGAFRLKKKNPTLCLTHDLDYLKSTTQMNLKRVLATRKFQWRQENYFASIKKIIDFDLAIGGASTFFVAAPKFAGPGIKRLQQWILDPSYRLTDPEFVDVFQLFKNRHVDVGIHGSFYSHTENTLQQEVQSLSQYFDKPVLTSRQHWLNLPSPIQDLQRIYDSGIRIDTTLGWNGNVGFRGGLSRAFPIQLSHGNLFLLPMVLMDGPLFDDLKLSKNEVVNLSKQLLDEVFKRNGTVAIDWHERSAHSSYGWFQAYEEIVNWAAKKGFDFKSVTQLLTEEGETYADGTI